METPKIFESEYRFCLILWENEPVSSGKLVELCKEGLGWSKATTYTVIRRLSERGVLKNENTIVTSLISKEEAQKSRLEEMVEETFEGSIPAFIAAFTRSKKLSSQEVSQLKALIDRTVCRWTEVKNKEFYYIMTAADSGKESMETTLACFRGYADCVEGAKEMGVVYGTGVYEKGEIKDKKAMNEAYEMGKRV